MHAASVPVLMVMAIVDDGIGIDPGDLINIFNFGYTSKENGSGIGLHDAANLARAMGGLSMQKVREGKRGRFLHW